VAVALIAAGALGLGFGYWGVAHARYVPDGLAFVVSGGLGGLFLLGLGATLLLSADLHDEWRKFDRIEETLQRVEAGLAAAGFIAAPAEPPEAPAPNGASRPVPEPPGADESRAAPDRSDRLEPPVTAGRAAAPVLNHFGLLRCGAGACRGPSLGAALGFILAVAALAGGWLLAATAQGPGRAVGGVAVAAGGLLLAGVGALVSTGGRRRRIGRRAAAVVRGVGRVEAAAGTHR
jgi:hypothetical protein